MTNGAVGRPRRVAGSWQSPTREFFSRLPRDPEVLVHRLREENTGSWFGPFAAGVTALRTCLVPADLRAALCLALACLPGVRATEGVENVDGVACLALVHDAGRTRTELMLSPDDGQFAGERDTVRTGSRTGLAAGTVISSTAVRTTVVDEPARSADPDDPAPAAHRPRRPVRRDGRGCEVGQQARTADGWPSTDGCRDPRRP